MWWPTALGILAVLEIGVLLALRRMVFRRVWLVPVGLQRWRAAPDQPSSTATDLAGALAMMGEIRGVLHFHGQGPPEFDHPAFHLAPEAIEELLTQEPPPTVGCGTYANLVARAFGEEGVASRVVVAFSHGFSRGHVMVEAWLDETQGWVLFDPLYGAVFEGADGVLLDAPELRRALTEGRALGIHQIPAPEGRPGLPATRLREELRTGLLHHLVAYPYAHPHRRRAPLLASGWALDEGETKWWRLTRALQVAGAVIPLWGILAIALWLTIFQG